MRSKKTLAFSLSARTVKIDNVLNEKLITRPMNVPRETYNWLTLSNSLNLSMDRSALVESQAVIREGLRLLLSKEPTFSVFLASDPIALFRQTWSPPPDLVVINKVMTGMNGIEAIQEIKKRWKETKVLIFTTKNAEENILRAFQAGANGYILKCAHPDELLYAITHLLSGNYYVCPGIMPRLIEGYCRMEKTMIESICGIKLTTRERELLKLIAEGNKNKGIDNIICLSLKTVETHRYNLMRKLDLHNVADLTLFAIQAGTV